MTDLLKRLQTVVQLCESDGIDLEVAYEAIKEIVDLRLQVIHLEKEKDDLLLRLKIEQDYKPSKILNKQSLEDAKLHYTIKEFGQPLCYLKEVLDFGGGYKQVGWGEDGAFPVWATPPCGSTK